MDARGVRGHSLRFFDELGDDARAALRAVARPRSYPAGTALMFPGQVGDTVAVLVAGAVKIVAVAADGREALLGVRSAGDLVGELAALDGRPRSAGIYAIGDAEALVVAASDFRALMRREPDVAERVVLVLAERLRDADLKRGEQARDSVARVASRIVELAERFGVDQADGVHIELPITQPELAAWAGASVESVARALGALREAGWISTARRAIVVHDVAALRDRAGQ